MASVESIESFLESNKGETQITYYNFSILNTLVNGDDTMEFSDTTIIDDYKDELLEQAVDVKMSDVECTKYFYNPGLLAYDIYGDTEYEFIVLKLNGIIDPKDFDMRTIKLIPADTLATLLTDIYNAEKKFIDINRNRESENWV